MYEAFYGLKEKPFTLTPNPAFFYLSEAHREALDHLLYGIQQREGFIAITGDVGTGKTTLCRALLGKLDDRTKTALIFNPVLSEEELLRSVLHDFGLSGEGTTKKELVDELNRFLIALLTEGKNAVLIVDEAQDLSADILEQIRLLSNLETEREKLIQIILVGQLELLDLLGAPTLKQLNQRVSVRYRIRPLTEHEANQYVFHRLLVAGSTGETIFSAPALKAIYRYTKGVPRLMNLVCDRALLQGFVDQDPHITPARVAQAVRSLDPEVGMGPTGPPAPRSWWTAPVITAAVGLVLVVGFGGGWLAARSGGPATPASQRPTVPAAREAPFAVFVSSHVTEAEARQAEQRLLTAGYTPFTALRASAEDSARYWVFAGRFDDVEQANDIRDRLVNRDGYADPRTMRLAESGERRP